MVSNGVEKIIIVVLKLPSFDSPACRVGPWLAFGNLDFWKTIPRTGSSLGLNCLCKQYILNTCFPSGSLEYRYMLGRGCPWDQPPIKTLDTESLKGFPGRQHLTHVVTTCCCGNCISLSLFFFNFPGRGPLEACACLPPDFTTGNFSLCWFCFVSFHCNKS